MKEHVWIKLIPNQELSVYQFGYEECVSGHSFGPANRDHYLLHFIKKGKGEFRTESDSYSLEAGQGFMISPDKISSYKADEDDPWVYFWIGFGGLDADRYMRDIGITPENPVFSFEDWEPFENIYNNLRVLDKSLLSDRLKMLGNLFMLIAEMAENVSQLDIKRKVIYNSKEEYVKNAVGYIEQNFSGKLNISEIVKFVGLNRSYFGVIFKEIMKMSPIDYLVSYRIDRAKKYLLNDSMNIGDVSRSVGYDDPLAFSKIFKKKVGVSPGEFRKVNKK